MVYSVLSLLMYCTATILLGLQILYWHTEHWRGMVGYMACVMIVFHSLIRCPNVMHSYTCCLSSYPGLAYYVVLCMYCTMYVCSDDPFPFPLSIFVFHFHFPFPPFTVAHSSVNLFQLLSVIDSTCFTKA